MTDVDPLAVLAMAVRHAGGLKRWGAQFGLSYEYVRLLLRGEREMSDTVLRSLGLVKVVTYRFQQDADPPGDES